jgi:acyl-CoA thioesterase-1
LRGIDPAVTRANLGQILSRAQERALPVLLVAIAAPGNYGPGYKNSFDAMFPKLARTYDATLYPGFFEALRKNGDAAALDKLIQPDGIHPNAAGVKVIIADFGPAVLDWVRKISPGS